MWIWEQRLFAVPLTITTQSLPGTNPGCQGAYGEIPSQEKLANKLEQNMIRSAIDALKRHSLCTLYMKLRAEQKNSKNTTIDYLRERHEHFADVIQDIINEREEEDMETRPNHSARIQELQDQIDSLFYGYEALGSEDRSEVHRQRNPLIIERDRLIAECEA